MRLYITGLKYFHVYSPKLSIFRQSLSVLRIMASEMSNQLDRLLTRLNEAERRSKLLNNEVKRIKGEILLLKSSVTTMSDASNNITMTRKKARSSSDEGDGTSPQSKRTKTSFTKDDKGYVIVYTDGACENNGKPHAKAGIGVWFGDNHALNISEPVEGKATNNNAEIQACVEALKLLSNEGVDKVKIFTDSQFTINCMTKWIMTWKRKNWKLASGGPVKNKEELQKLDNIMQKFDVLWEHVAGHKGVKGNEEADKLAREGAQRYYQN